MKALLPALALSLALSVAIVPAQASVFGKSPEQAAAQAASENAQAVTIWVGATWGFRNQGAANDLTRAHKAFAAQGYRVLSVEPYIEDGDLKGFFVTYQKP